MRSSGIEAWDAVMTSVAIAVEVEMREMKDKSQAANSGALGIRRSASTFARGSCGNRTPLLSAQPTLPTRHNMIGCTCRAALRTQRTLAGLPSRAKSLSTSSLRSASPSPTPSATPSAPKPSTRALFPGARTHENLPIPLTAIPQSSCVAGTRITGLQTLKDGADPIALEDHEYPAWLWTLVAPEKRAGKQVEVARSDAEKLKDARRELQRAGTAGIKAANTLKAK